MLLFVVNSFKYHCVIKISENETRLPGIIDFKLWFKVLTRVTFLYEELIEIFESLKFQPYNIALLKNKLQTLKFELLTNHICIHLFVCLQASRVPKLCQLCTSFYVSCQTFDRYLSLELANTYLSKDCLVVYWTYCLIKHFSLDLHYFSYSFLNLENSRNFWCVCFDASNKAS